MMTVKIKISNIDYSDIVEKVFPIISDKLKKKADTQLLVDIIEDISSIDLKNIINILPQKAQDDIALLIIQKYKEELVKQVNEFVQSKGMNIDISSIDIEKFEVNDMMTVKINISNIDYSDIVEKFFPLIADNIKEKSSSLLVSAIISKTKGLQGTALKAGIKVLPQKTQDEIAVLIIQKYKEELVKQANEFVTSKGMNIDIYSIDIENVV